MRSAFRIFANVLTSIQLFCSTGSSTVFLVLLLQLIEEMRDALNAKQAQSEASDASKAKIFIQDAYITQIWTYFQAGGPAILS